MSLLCSVVVLLNFIKKKKEDFIIVNKMVCNFGSIPNKCKPQTLP